LRACTQRDVQQIFFRTQGRATRHTEHHPLPGMRAFAWVGIQGDGSALFNGV